MLPGKKYLPEDVLLILRRRVWFLVVPFAVIGAGVAIYAKQLPDVFVSQATILVVPQRVPESYVRSTVSQRIEERLGAIRAQIMSRTKLEAVIQELNLYPELRQSVIMEDLVDRMRREVNITAPRADLLLVSSTGREPRTVMKVAEKLTELLINETYRDRENLAENTGQFLDSQIDEVRQNLLQYEKKLADYRTRFAGELPSQQDTNLQAMSSAQMQVQAIVESLNSDRQRLLNFERQLEELESQADPAASSVAPSNPNTAAQQLTVARQALVQLQTQLTDDHPDIKTLKGRILELERKADAESLAQPVSGDAGVPAVELARRKRVATLQAEMKNLQAQIVKKQETEELLRRRAGEYQRRAEASPTRETELIELTRGYDIVTSTYRGLLSKREDSKISSNLERRQVGEQFQILDAARLPLRPSSPNRESLYLLGMGVGLATGFGLVLLLEYRDRSMKTDDEVVSVLQIPVLAVVPLMLSDSDQVRIRRRKWIMGLGLGSTVAFCLAIIAYAYLG